MPVVLAGASIERRTESRSMSVRSLIPGAMPPTKIFVVLTFLLGG